MLFTFLKKLLVKFEREVHSLSSLSQRASRLPRASFFKFSEIFLKLFSKKCLTL